MSAGARSRATSMNGCPGSGTRGACPPRIGDDPLRDVVEVDGALGHVTAEAGQHVAERRERLEARARSAVVARARRAATSLDRGSGLRRSAPAPRAHRGAAPPASAPRAVAARRQPNRSDTCARGTLGVRADRTRARSAGSGNGSDMRTTRPMTTPLTDPNSARRSIESSSFRVARLCDRSDGFAP